MLRFLVDNWLAILSMIVAIAGGVPGILAFIEYFKDKPGFAFIVANWITGEIDAPITLDSHLFFLRAPSQIRASSRFRQAISS